MNILITGTADLSKEISNALNEFNTELISRKTGNDINFIHSWGDNYLHFDAVINLAYDGWGQITVLEFFYSAWKNDPTKTIINVGSKVSSYERTEKELENIYWNYRLHKQGLQAAFEKMVNTCKCDIKLINPGPVETKMTEHLNIEKLNKKHFANLLKEVMFNPYLKRVDLWK